MRHGTTLRSAFEDYQLACGQLSAQTQRWYTQKLETFIAYCEAQGIETVDEVRAADVRRFLAHLKEHAPSGRTLSTYTQHGYVQVVKGFWTFLEREELLDTNPIARVENVRVDVRVIETFTVEQVRCLFAAARQGQYPLRDQAILSVLLDSGIRASELCGLVLEHVHLTPASSYIQVFGKRRKERQVGLGAQARTALQRYLTRERPAVDLPWVFLAKGRKPFNVNSLESLIERLGHRAGVTGVRVSPHTFRHTFAVNYLRAGGNLYSLSRLLGHTSVQVTENYLRSWQQEDARRQPISVLEAMWS